METSFEQYRFNLVLEPKTARKYEMTRVYLSHHFIRDGLNLIGPQIPYVN